MDRDRGKASEYAVLVPKLRMLKSRLVKEDRIREVIAQPSIEEAAPLLKDSIYQEALQYRDPEQIQATIVRVFYREAARLQRYAPPGAFRLIEAFRRDLESRDLFTAAAMIEAGRSEIISLPTARVPGTLLDKIRQEPEALTSISRLAESLRKTWAYPYLSLAQRLMQEHGASILSWMPLAVSAREYGEALDLLDPRLGKKSAAQVLCPVLEWRLAAAMINAKRLALPTRILDQILADISACRFRWRTARQVYEREPGVDGLMASLREVLPRVKLDPSRDPVEALEEARVAARSRAKQAALSVFHGYPFHAGLLAAGLMLLLLEAEDLSTILTGIGLGLKPEEYVPSTTYRLGV